MAGVLVVFLPMYAAMALISAGTRGRALTPLDYFNGLAPLAVGVVAYALSRSSSYRLGIILMSAVTIVFSCVIGAREPDAIRALGTVLFGMCGVLYPSLTLSRRQTLFAGVGYLVMMTAALVGHPGIAFNDMVFPWFFTVFMVVMIVVGAHLRRMHVDDLALSAQVVATSESRLRATLDSALDAVVVIDDAGLVVEWGGVAASTFGVSTGEAVGRPLTALIGSPPTASMVPPEGSKHPKVARFEFVARHQSGRSFPCEVVAAPLKTGSGAAVFLRDVSEQRKLETRLLLTDRLETMGRMVAGVAHEVNNPLAFVMSNLGHLERELSRPTDSLDASELKGVVIEALDGARRIQGIVRNLRSFSRSGEQEKMEPVDVERALEASIHMVQAQLRETRAMLHRDYHGAGVVMAYEGRLGQVFLNLLINAIQSLPGEGGRRDIVVHTERVGTEVRVSIQDSGTGIEPATLSRLFEPFFTTKPKGQGTGLGLSISQNIIATLGGEIVVESKLGVGTKFSVVLPTTPQVSTISPAPMRSSDSPPPT